MNNFLQRGNILFILTIMTVLLVGAIIYVKTSLQPEFRSYTSQALKISIKYPKGWYIDDRYRTILLTSYSTNLNRDDKPTAQQLELLIDEFSGCFPTLEEDLIDPACGQGKVKNKILSKDARQTPGGEFLKYTLESYDENQRIQYFFRKDERILQISKHPDPSQFEKEFNQIINSIKFQ